MFDSLEMKRALSEQLNYDDAIFVNYYQPGIRISIYVAYWAPERMSQRLVAGHTPDVCWVAGGWKSVTKHIDRAIVNDGTTQLNLERRLFIKNERKEYLVFSHIVGGQVSSYQHDLRSPLYAFVSELFTKGFRQREEQLFIRISSDRPFEEFRFSAPVSQFIDQLMNEVGKMKVMLK